jgi:hypothetical protein
MTEFDGLRFAGIVLLIIGYATLVARSRTAGFGLTTLNLFVIASGTLSAFVVGRLTGQTPDSFGEEHLFVVSYSIAGLLAMLAGMAIAWRPLMDRQHSVAGAAGFTPPLAHLTREVGWLTFCVGAGAELVFPFVYTIPTLSTAVFCMAALERIGLCILLIAALRENRWGRFYVAFAIFCVLSMATSLATGFSFIRINTLLPLAVIWLVGAGLSGWNVLRVSVLAPAAALLASAGVAAWLDTRDLIRSGSLEQLPRLEQVREFTHHYWDRLAFPSAESLMRTLLQRVDMTDLLAAQVQHQPSVEPYALGETVLSSFYALIPRALWPAKPVVAGGSEFVSRFTGLQWNDSTSVGLPYPFELYANGGAIAVVVGLGIIGYLGGRLERQLLAGQRSLGVFWALALVTAVVTEGGQRAEVALPALVASATTAYVIGSLIQRFSSVLPETSSPRTPQDYPLSTT